MTLREFSQQIPGLAESRYAAAGVRPPTAEQLVKLIAQDIIIEEQKFGAWPDPLARPGCLETWRNRVHHRLHGYLAHLKVQKDAAKDIIRGIKEIMEKEQRFDWQHARELADKDLAIRSGEMPKQHPKPFTPVAPGTFSNAASLATKPDVGDTAHRLNEELVALRMDFMTISDEKKYPRMDPGNLRDEIWKRHGVKSDEQIITHIDYDRSVIKAEFASAIDNWQAAKLAESRSPDEKPDLDKIFPRDENNRPVDDPALFEKSKENIWKGFYTQATIWGYTADEVKAKVFGGVAHMADTGLEPNEAIRKLKDYHFAKPAETSIAKIENNTPPSNDKGGTSAANVEKVQPPMTNNDTPKAADLTPPANNGTNSHTEAPFSMNFRMMHPLGIEVQFTIRDEKVADGVDKLEKLLPILIERGYTAANGNGRSHLPAQIPTATNGNAETGEQISECAMIKLGSSYTGGALQLQFEVNGLEHTVNYTRPVAEMIALLSGVRKANGAAFTADDLQAGNKFGGMWKLAWKAKDKDGKTYRDAVRVMPA